MYLYEIVWLNQVCYYELLYMTIIVLYIIINMQCAICDMIVWMHQIFHKRHSAPFSGAWSDFPLVVYYYTVEYFSQMRNLEQRPFATLRTGSTISDSALGKCHPLPLTALLLLGECIVVYCTIVLIAYTIL